MPLSDMQQSDEQLANLTAEKASMPTMSIPAARQRAARDRKQFAIVGMLSAVILVVMLVSGYISVLNPAASLWVQLIFILASLLYTTGSVLVIFLTWRISVDNDITTDTLLRSVSEYQRQSIQLEVAAQIARDAAEAPDVSGLLQQATTLIHERFGYYHAGIFQIEGDYAVLRAAAGSTVGSYIMLQQEHHLRVGTQGIIGAVAAVGQARVSLDVSLDGQHYVNPHLPATKAEVALPMKSDGRVTAILDVQSTLAGDFRKDDIRILQVLADLLAAALNKAQLNAKVQAEADLLEKHVQERTAELAGERAQLRAIVDNMQEGVIYHRQKQALYTNHAFNELFQIVDTNTWLGFERAILSHDDASTSIHDEMMAAFADYGRYKGEVRLLRQDGSSFDASMSCTMIDAANEAIVSVVRDISQEKTLREQKQRFLAYASHELRTPITNLKTRLYLMKKQPQRFDEHYDIVGQVVGRMQRLVDDLLSHTRLEQGRIILQRQRHCLQELIENVIRTQRPEAESKQLGLQTNLPETRYYVSFDWDRLIQVLTNLVANAINYTPSGKITVTLVDEGQVVAIHVQDTGIGISPHVQTQLFQPFVRGDNVKMMGTGLGLVISRQIMELHGGTLTFHSVEGQGSTFTMRLQHDRAVATNASEAATSRQSYRVDTAAADEAADAAVDAASHTDATSR